MVRPENVRALPGELIATIEGKLAQRVTSTPPFPVGWRLPA